MYDDWGWRPYVPVAVRRARAARQLAKLKKKGQTFSPVVLQGRTIARTFWGKAWCENLEGYSDFENRLPRGRAYVRNGSVLDLQITAGEIKAKVVGSSLYDVMVKVKPVSKARWGAICSDCGGAIDSLVELLQGRFSKGVMERLCRRETGLFPSPQEITLACSCPDWAAMCKHVAAVLYGIGARLDEHPELLFRLHQVDEHELLAKASEGLTLGETPVAAGRALAGEDLSAMFGLDMAETGEADRPSPTPATKPKRQKKLTAKRATAMVREAERKPKRQSAPIRARAEASEGVN